MFFINRKGKKEEGKVPKFGSPSEFIKWFRPKAEFLKKLHAIDERAVVAQAALETGWGNKFPIDTESGKFSYNFFGIKWYEGWPSDHVTCITKEYNAMTGNLDTITAQFRAYKSTEECLLDYLSLVERRYHKAWEGRRSYKKYALGLQEGGWATDQHYAEKIIQIVEQRMEV